MHETTTVTLCSSCRHLSLGTGGEQPHASMRLQGARPPEQYDGALERQYRCIECNTIWLRRTDKWGIDAGFRMLP